MPNGLAFSPDESVLYINDSRRGHIRAFDLLPNGTLAKQTDRVFVDLRGEEPGVPDGMKVDVEGNVYCGGAGGLWIMDPRGKKLGRIVHGATATTNLAFGGNDWKTLYFTSRNHLGSVNVKISGIPVPVQKKELAWTFSVLLQPLLMAPFPRERAGMRGSVGPGTKLITL